ncbi:MAG: serine hydrolase domain-containing protein [Gemmatimonadaceae bacterium]
MTEAQSRRWRVELLAAVLLAAALRALAAPAPRASAPWSSRDFAGLDSFVTSAMRERGVPGLQIAVIRGDRVVHLRAFGRADPSGRTVTVRTPFRIGSNTKGFTALAIMQLAERGRLELGAPVQRYLPWFGVADSAASARITVADLLYHTSGIPGSANYDSFLDPALTLEQYVRALRSVRLARPVGSAFEYSNANYNVLGLVVQAVSGESYGGYVRSHILAPLGMTHTTTSAEEERRQGLAQGYNWWFGVLRPARDPFSAANLPAGYLSSTAEDLSHYLIAQMNGGRYGATSVLSPAGIAAMHAPGPHTHRPGQSATPAGYGMGWAVGANRGVPVFGHDGATWSFHSLQMVDSRDGWGLIVLANADNQVTAFEPHRAITRGAFARLAGLPPPPTGPSLRVFYVVLDAVLLVASAWIVWGLLRVPRWSAALRRRQRARHGRWRTAGTLARVALEVLVPALLLVASPRLAGASWRVLLVTAPDLGWWALAASALLLATGLLHGALLVRARSAGGDTVRPFARA